MAKSTTERPKAARTAKARTIVTAKAIASGDVSQSSLDIISNATSKSRDLDLYWMCYAKHPWVRAVVDAIAKAVSAEGFLVGPVMGEDATLLGQSDDPRGAQIMDFFAHAFPNRTWRSEIFALATDVLVYGVGYWRKARANGLVVGLERFDPRTVTARLNDSKTAILRYTVRPLGSDFTMATTTYEAADVIMFTFPGGDVVTGAPSKLESLDLTLAGDMLARQYRNSFFQNGAKAGGVLVFKGADEEQVKAAARMIQSQRAGVRNAFTTWLLAGDFEYTPMPDSGKNDGDFLKLSAMTRDEVCAAYHVPPGKIVFSGNALGSSGKSEDDATFQEWAVLPLEELIYEKLTIDLLHNEFGETDLALAPNRRNRIRYDRIDAAQGIVKSGGTGNEARALMGLAPISDPRFPMDVPLFIGHTAMTVEADEPNSTPAPLVDGNVEEHLDAVDEVAGKATRRFRGRMFGL